MFFGVFEQMIAFFLSIIAVEIWKIIKADCENVHRRVFSL
jgi:hypothetical protein